MNMKLKLEIAKVFTLEFECSSGKKKEETSKEEENYLQRGIKARSFRQCFQLVEHDRVLDATLRNGILEIDIKRENPEPKKHVTMQIRNG